MTTDPAEQWQAHVTDSLRKRRCPHSGGRLYRNGDGLNSLSCAMCDCFGYNPADERIGKR